MHKTRKKKKLLQIGKFGQNLCHSFFFPFKMSQQHKIEETFFQTSFLTSNSQNLSTNHRKEQAISMEYKTMLTQQIIILPILSIGNTPKNIST